MTTLDDLLITVQHALETIKPLTTTAVCKATLYGLAGTLTVNALTGCDMFGSNETDERVLVAAPTNLDVTKQDDETLKLTLEAHEEYSDGTTSAPDSMQLRTATTELKTVKAQKTINITYQPDGETTLEAIVWAHSNESDEMITQRREKTLDLKPPELTIEANEPDNYGHVELKVNTDERADITTYLKNQAGTDSVEVLQASDRKTLDTMVKATLLDNNVGDTATLRVNATDQAGNTTTGQTQVTIDGGDHTFLVKGASPVSAEKSSLYDNNITDIEDGYVIVKQGNNTIDTLVVENGEASGENLHKDITYQAHDELHAGRGDWMPFQPQHTTVTTDATIPTVPMMPTTNTPPQIDAPVNPYNNIADFLKKVPEHFKNIARGLPGERPHTVYIDPDSADTQEQVETARNNVTNFNTKNQPYNFFTTTTDSANADVVGYFSEKGTTARPNESEYQLGTTLEGNLLIKLQAHEKTHFYQLQEADTDAQLASNPINDGILYLQPFEARAYHAAETIKKADIEGLEPLDPADLQNYQEK